MKKLSLLLSCLFAAYITLNAQTPTLGTYNNTIIATAGSSINITPSAAPLNTTRISASTTTNFKGILHADTATGVVYVTNAHPAGTYSITVRGFNGTASVSSSFIITVGPPLCSQGYFSNAADLTGSEQYSIATGDFNADGKQDIATTHVPELLLRVRLGNGAGSFTTSASIPIGGNSRKTIVKDINNDGRQDILVAINEGQFISIFMGNGNGTFNTPVNVPFGYAMNNFTISDFNNDSKQDLAVINDRGISIRLGNGDGSFTSAPNVFIDDNLYNVVAADFNSDGKTDLAFTNFQSHYVAIRLGNGNGGFTSVPNLFAGNSPFGITVGDFNGDGKPDLATSSQYTNYVNICLGNGNGSFSTNTQINIGNNANDIATADFNGDGKADVAVTGREANAVIILSGNGTGSFVVTGTTPIGTYPEAIAIGDFNSDGLHDLAVANSVGNFTSIRLGSANDIIIQGNGITIPDGNTATTTTNHTDFGNAAGRQQRTYTIQNPSAVKLNVSSIRVSGTDTAFFRIGGITTPFEVLPGGTSTFTIDFVPNSAGLKTATVNLVTNHCTKANYDFVVQGNGVSATAAIGTYANTVIATAGLNVTITPAGVPANASFVNATTSTSFKGLLQVNAATGVVTVTNAHPAGVYPVTVKAINWSGVATTTFMLTVNNTNCSRGQFTVSPLLPTGDLYSKIRVADFNNDGKQDIILTKGSANTAYIRLGNGTGGFTGALSLSIPTYTLDILTTDFNGDGNTDLAYTGNGVVTVKLGDGAGNFTGNTVVPVPGAESIVTGDFNSDGVPDLLVADISAAKVVLRLGDGTGHFTNGVDVPFTNSNRCMVAGDFNGDGNLDFAARNSANSIGVRLGNGAGGFTAATDIPVQNDPWFITLGDFNNDGRQDIATSNYEATSVSIRLGNGIGGFTGTTNLIFTSTPRVALVGDYNGDGKQDLAVVCSQKVDIRFGDGTGNFSEGNSTTTLGYASYGAAGDFNGDGKQDIVNVADATANSSVLLGTDRQVTVKGNNVNIANGAITVDTADFTQFDTTSVGLGTSRTFTIQNTGGAALAISNITLSGSGTAAFTLSGLTLPASIAAGASVNLTVRFPALTVGTYSATITVATDDCDEPVFSFAIRATAILVIPDISAYPNVSVVAGGGIIVLPVSIPVNTLKLTAIATGTSNSDALFKGVLTANPVTGAVNITNAYPAGQYRIILKAFNGSSTDTAQFQLTVSTNNICGPGLFGPGLKTATGISPQKPAIGDFNEDSLQDLAVPNISSNSVSIRLGNGNGGFAGNTSVATGARPKTVIVGDFNGDGHQDFAVANYSSTGSISIRLGNGTGNFTGNTEIAVDSFPVAMAEGDFNNDGYLDLAIVCQTDAATVFIKLGDGDGNFIGTNRVSINRAPFAIVTGDFNNDGNLDFAISGTTGTNQITVRLGDGSGNFTNAPSITLSATPYDMIAGDFNNDGITDLAIPDYTQGVHIRLGTGNGSFTGTAYYATGTYPRYLSTGDFNVDGKQDLAVANVADKTVSMMAGDGTGGFTKITNVVFTGTAAGIVTGDFNRDGRQDFAVSESDSGSVVVRLNALNQIVVKGNNTIINRGSNTPSATNNTDFGSTGSSAQYAYSIHNTGTVPLRVDSLRLGGVAAAQFTIHGITWPLTVAAGDSVNFRLKFVPVAAGIQPARLYVFSNDCDEGVYDFALQGNGVVSTVSLSTYAPATVVAGTDTSILCTAISNVAFAVATTSAGFKGFLQVIPATGKLIITNAYPAGTYTITVKAGNGFSVTSASFILTVTNPVCSNASFSAVSVLPSQQPETMQGAVIGDFNNDGYQDIAALGGNDFPFVNVYPIYVYLKNPVGNYVLQSTFSAGDAVGKMTVGDINGDGQQDIIVSSANGIYLKLGDGAGNFYGNDTLQRTYAYDIIIADINNDSLPDIITLNYSVPGNISKYLGNGKGQFTKLPDQSTGFDIRSMAKGDLNNDGNVDIVVASEWWTSGLYSLIGDGTGNFTSTGSLPMGPWVKKLALADFNKDGNLDVAATNNSDPGTVSVRLGDGTGGFGAIISSSVAIGPNEILTADFNGDGYLDIATSGTNLYSISVRLGNGTGSFTGSTLLTPRTGVNYTTITVGDMNRDGRHDIIAGGGSLSKATILYGAGNEINVRGNNNTIPDGDTIPTLTSHTYFGNVLPNNSLVRTFTIQNTGVSTALTISSVGISGADSASFTRGGITLPVTIAAGSSVTFTVRFSPQSSGLKSATININSNDCDEGNYNFAISGRSPQPGASLDFDGVDDYVTVNNITTGNINDSAITISTYLKTTDTTTATLLSKRVNCTQTSYFDFGINAAGRLFFVLGDGSGHVQTITGHTPVNNGLWHQATAVRIADTLRLYVDGNLDTSLITNGVANINNMQSLVIGANRCNGITNFFKGQIDELRLYSRGLSTAEIQTSVSCEMGGAQAGLLLYYKFNQGAAADTNAGLMTVQDASSFNRTGTLQNFALSGNTSNWVAPGGVSTGILCTGRSVWLGLSANWDDPANWSTGFVPLEQTRVEINTGVPNPPEITSPNAVCYSITLSNGATINIRSTGRLTIVGP